MEGLRFERKFLVPELSRAELLTLLRVHPALFREIHAERTVSNLYLDTPDLSSYRANLDGVSQARTKVRIRWYGELIPSNGTVERPVLEFKIREGLLNRKESYPLPPLGLRRGGRAIEREGLGAYLRSAGLCGTARARVEGLVPALLNSYRRRYFRSGDGLLRATLDWDLDFQATDSAAAVVVRERHARVLELKYAPEDDDAAARVAQGFSFRLTRSSKYVMGIEAVRASLPV